MTGLLSICHLDPKPEASNSTPRSKDQQPLTSPPSDKTFWDLANSHNNPWSGVHEARAAKLEPRDPVQDPRLKVRGPWSKAVIQTVIQNRALADRC